MEYSCWIPRIVVAVFLLGFILFLSRWIEMIPFAALVGLLFVVSEKTFEFDRSRAQYQAQGRSGA